MNLRKTAITAITAICACFVFLSFSANAEIKFADKMKMEDAVNTALSLVKDSVYKDVEVTTNSGSFSGELIKRSGSVLVLKRKTGSIHLKTNKEKINYILVDIDDIVGISFYALD